MEELVTIATYTDPMQAHIAKDVLGLSSIDCCLLDENMASMGFLLPGSSITIRLQVRESDAERAVEILDQELGDEVSGDDMAGEIVQEYPENRYQAAGAVIVHGDWVLVLRRPGRNEVRLPKGHIDDGEDPLTSAFREVEEESGYINLRSVCDLGIRILEFDRENVHVVREEHFYLMTPVGDEPENKGEWEAQFEPEWVSWDEAEQLLTYENEKEWLRTAREKI